jgi:hypothetical protein
VTGALACAVALAVATTFAGAEQAPRPLETIVQDDALLLHGSPADVDRAAARIASVGTDRVRITAGWSVIAPQPRSRRRPAFDATDPSQYPEAGFVRVDRAVKAASRHGMKAMLDVAFWAPRWAVRRSTGDATTERWAPSPVEYGRFAEAVARRYDGTHPDPEAPGRTLPAVDLWTTWNEPNHPSFLLPQWKRVGGRWRPAAPHVYRRLHEAGYAAIKKVRPANRVLLGGLAAIGNRGRGVRRGMDPLPFLRELACVGPALSPLRTPECRGFRALRADGFAHHPYSFGTSPAAVGLNPDTARLGELDRLSALLRALHGRGRIAAELPIHITEYGYETSPPDGLRGVSLDDQARHLSHATFLAWRRDDTASFAQFLLQDIGPDPRARPGSPAQWRSYQTGLTFEDGREKPALQAFKLPFWVEAHALAGREVVVAFGQVRPGRGRHRVAIEALGTDGVWRTIGTLEGRTAADRACDGESTEFLTDPEGFYLRALPYEGPLSYRPRWTRPDGGVEYGVPIAAARARTPPPPALSGAGDPSRAARLR